jgi:lysylphosphatidylglycerol synthetase-like protein (DUF2156 family)
MSPRIAQRTLTRRHVAWSSSLGVILLLLLVGIAWKATNVLWFLLFPLLLIGLVTAAATAVLWGLRHF